MSSPLYPVTQPLQGIDPNMFPAKVLGRKLFKQWLPITPLYNMMGMEENRPIVIHRMKEGDGLQYSVGRLSLIDYTKPAKNLDQVRGSGQQQKVDSDSVICELISFDMPFKGRGLMRLATPVDLPAEVNNQLVMACQRHLNKSLLDSAMFDYKNAIAYGSGYNPATQLPSYDRVAMAGINNGDTATQNTADRTAYYNFGNLNTAWANLSTGTAYNQNGLSVDHLLKLKSVAIEGGYPGGAVSVGGTDIEDAIEPAFLKTRSGWPIFEYIYLCSTASYRQLRKDPDYRGVALERGTVISPDQPEAISGATYHGKFEGIHIYEVPDLSKYISTISDGAGGFYRIGWELFIGAAAFSLGWFEEPWIAHDKDDIDLTDEWASHETRGQKALKFPAKQASAGGRRVEQGIVHSFVRV